MDNSFPYTKIDQQKLILTLYPIRTLQKFLAEFLHIHSLLPAHFFQLVNFYHSYQFSPPLLNIQSCICRPPNLAVRLTRLATTGTVGQAYYSRKATWSPRDFTS